jgi:transposase
VPFYPAADDDVQPAPVPGAVACRCCPGGISRSRRACRYPSDMTGAEWAVCEPLLPAPAWLAGRGGRPASWCMRDIVDAIRYLTHNGPVWRALPADFPPAGTVYWWAGKWQADGSAERMHDDLRSRIRLAAGRTSAPTAAIIDSQSVKGSEMIARGRRGFDAGKKINGTKRHIAVDTLGLLLTVLVTAASVQDRDAARPLLWNLRKAFPSVTLAWADGGYAGKLITWAKTRLKPKLTLQIVKRPDDLHTFQVLPRRWVVERTLSWITRHRRTVRDYERLPAHHETYIYWAMIIIMTRRLARQPATARLTATRVLKQALIPVPPSVRCGCSRCTPGPLGGLSSAAPRREPGRMADYGSAAGASAERGKDRAGGRDDPAQETAAAKAGCSTTYLQSQIYVTR